MTNTQIKLTPQGYSTVTPWIVSPSTAKLIDFLTGAFGAEEIPHSRITNEEGCIIHVVVKIGDSLIMLFDSRKCWGPTPALLNLYVADVEDTYNKALDLGATSVTDITTLYFGEKVCRIIDPFGNLWWLNQRVEEVDFTNAEDMQRRASTPEAIAGVAYIQSSLNDAMLRQKDFF
ncbi:VOC family protein [Mucilaginibacter pedocola]|nr:VOC family protein [Mucilaginibacter pedocola]